MALAAASCTDLDETVYSEVMSDNYYNTKMDVIRAVNRPFEHMYWGIQQRMPLNELSADQIITPTRDSWWTDGGKWERIHYHNFDPEMPYITEEWEGDFKGIMFCNYVIEDLERLDGTRFGFTEDEFSSMKMQCRVMAPTAICDCSTSSAMCRPIRAPTRLRPTVSSWRPRLCSSL